jgi:hypothetical protein
MLMLGLYLCESFFVSCILLLPNLYRNHLRQVAMEHHLMKPGIVLLHPLVTYSVCRSTTSLHHLLSSMVHHQIQMDIGAVFILLVKANTVTV